MWERLTDFGAVGEGVANGKDFHRRYCVINEIQLTRDLNSTLPNFEESMFFFA